MPYSLEVEGVSDPAIADPDLDEPAAPEASRARSGGLKVIARRLLGVNIALAALGLVSGPLQAHALGVDGRGQLAAIVSVATLAPWVVDLGLGSFLTRERARGVERSLLLGTVMPLVLILSVVGMIVALPVAALVSQGDPTVKKYVALALFLLPIGGGTQLLLGLVVGEQRWRLFATLRLISGILPVLSLIVLYVLDRLTVATASLTFIGSGIASMIPALPLLRTASRLVFDKGLARRALRFGAAGSLGSIAYLGSLRLDQVIMAPIVKPAELGLYAVATTISLLPMMVASAIASTIGPRIAASGDPELAARSSRVTGICTAGACALLAVVSPPLIPVLFGSGFTSAVPMLMVLLVATVFAATAAVVGQALTSGGWPEATARGQIAGLGVTVVLLPALLPLLGGLGAAIASAVAYGSTLSVQVWCASGTFGLPAQAFVRPRRADFRELAGHLRRA